LRFQHPLLKTRFGECRSIILLSRRKMFECAIVPADLLQQRRCLPMAQGGGLVRLLGSPMGDGLLPLLGGGRLDGFERVSRILVFAGTNPRQAAPQLTDAKRGKISSITRRVLRPLSHTAFSHPDGIAVQVCGRQV
jgi:hypothetical protein